MSKPNNAGWQKFKRLGRYLVGRPRLVICYDWQKPLEHITANSDSDWAGDKRNRKSTSGGIVRIGTHYIKSWSKNQSVIALSSAEAELYAIIKTASETLGLCLSFGIGIFLRQPICSPTHQLRWGSSAGQAWVSSVTSTHLTYGYNKIVLRKS